MKLKVLGWKAAILLAIVSMYGEYDGHCLPYGDIRFETRNTVCGLGAALLRKG